MERNQHQDQLQNELLGLRAPLAMMRALYGMTNAEYAARRKLLGLAGTGIGRPPAPSEDEERRIWQAWQATAQASDGPRYLEVGRTTGVPLHTVWALIRNWETSGLLPDASGPTDPKVVRINARER